MSLPVSGTLAKPAVDIGSAVNKAIGGMLKTIFPPTLIASLLSNVGKKGDPGLAPIAFEPGSAEMSDEARGYAEDVAEFLGEHPKLVLRLCGRATRKDRPDGTKEPSDQALQQLAVARKRAVRRYLIKVKSIDPKQIPECRSSYDARDEDNPRVEIDF